MAKILRRWIGTGFNNNVLLTEYEYSDGSIHYTFYDRFGHSGNPTKDEAKEIVKRWNLKEVKYYER